MAGGQASPFRSNWPPRRALQPSCLIAFAFLPASSSSTVASRIQTETIRKKKGVRTARRHADDFFHQGANLLQQARFKNLRQPASVFLEIGRFFRLSQFLKSECPNRQFIFRPPLTFSEPRISNVPPGQIDTSWLVP